MKYTIDYEVVRYDVNYITPTGKHINGRTFYTEEDAVEYALKYHKDHPEIQTYIQRLENAIVLVEDE